MKIYLVTHIHQRIIFGIYSSLSKAREKVKKITTAEYPVNKEDVKIITKKLNADY